MTTTPYPQIAPLAETGQQQLVLGGGCFWCTEAVFLSLQGVLEVLPGYAGGSAQDAHYDAVCSGTTGHAEVIAIRYDAAHIAREKLLEIFFTVAHDPTQLNRQGNDVGSQYRSVVFYRSAEEQQYYQHYLHTLNSSGYFAAPLATTLEPLEAFYPAEAQHHDYARRNPQQPYIRYVALPKLSKLHSTHPEQLAPPTSSLGEDLTPWSAEQIAARAATLNAEERQVLLHQGTEPPFCGTLLDNHQTGSYHCKLCALPLFHSNHKFNSGTGWPSYYRAIDSAHVRELEDHSHGMSRTEIRCARCDGHLGHVFPDGPAPTGLRYCLNSLSLTFNPEP